MSLEETQNQPSKLGPKEVRSLEKGDTIWHDSQKLIVEEVKTGPFLTLDSDAMLFASPIEGPEGPKETGEEKSEKDYEVSIPIRY